MIHPIIRAYIVPWGHPTKILTSMTFSHKFLVQFLFYLLVPTSQCSMDKNMFWNWPNKILLSLLVFAFPIHNDSPFIMVKIPTHKWILRKTISMTIIIVVEVDQQLLFTCGIVAINEGPKVLVSMNVKGSFHMERSIIHNDLLNMCLLKAWKDRLPWTIMIASTWINWWPISSNSGQVYYGLEKYKLLWMVMISFTRIYLQPISSHSGQVYWGLKKPMFPCVVPQVVSSILKRRPNVRE